MAINQENVWFITGTSSGLGRRLVTVALSRGDRVIATARSIDKIQDFPPSDNLRLLQLDVDSGPVAIKAKVDEAIAFWGRIDILVNNAGISLRGLIEEAGSEILRREFKTNVFGLIDVTTAVLPYMRKRRSGTIVMIGSRSSWNPVKLGVGVLMSSLNFDSEAILTQNAGMYAASKAAVHTFSETLAVEVAQFSIRILIVEPGSFRTEGIFSTPYYTDNPIPEYDDMRKRSMESYDEKKFKGDPVKGMEVLVDIVRGEGKAAGRPWPLYLIMGPGAEEFVRGKCELLDDHLSKWRKLTEGLELDEDE